MLSFLPSEEDSYLSFFEDFGFVVIRDVFSPEMCELSRVSPIAITKLYSLQQSAMWSVVEQLNPGLSRDNPNSWKSLKANGSYGLSIRGPCFHPQMVRNRCNPELIRVLQRLVGESILVSQDRFTIYRSTLCTPEAALYSTGDGISNIHLNQSLLGPKNIHLDLNPWWWLESFEGVVQGVDSLTYDNLHDFIRENNLVVRSMGRHVQCVLNFTDNCPEDGGTVLVPGFHKVMREWAKVNTCLNRPRPWFNYSDFKGDIMGEQLLQLAIRVPMRQVDSNIYCSM